MNNTENNVEEEKKTTLYDKLNAIYGDEIPLNSWVGQDSLYEPEEDYYVKDKEIMTAIRRKVIKV